MSVSAFMEKHYRHFNARETLAAAKSYRKFIDEGGKMLVSLAGAMSTAELGISLAEMIRQDKVHAISCTAANLEEDLFNLFAHNEYKVIEDWRALSAQDEVDLQANGFNRVTDTCIPETVMRHMESRLTTYWVEQGEKGEGMFPYEYFYRVLDEADLKQHYQVPIENSWVYAAKEKGLPIVSPGAEDSTLGNMFTARVMDGTVKSHAALKSGTAQLELLTNWYRKESQAAPIGFFQIGGGIAGDFAICAVPMLIQDLREDANLWSYFAQISDAVTSYGGYSGAVPNEKITWTKLSKESPKFMIQSDATIVAPLIFAYVLGQ
ncbi:deoxyhypusine synthase family protein [Aureliella helgolandensis]|uniref:Deoxyhypusine synthase-like protein n=1 Tax=Aureliella helgolandensis TaxID=2527968 RepID=A0A518FZD6_9BACT|nr:deoxyhypusine synthase family protein [Aureliella helgolandensis]QDV21725.1 deoxyhypusine synthase-like protein [Aureliella helgolandensis]